ncbi:hypothetical protein IFM61606_06370 [Aspergillus udagawae]|nr:hypothetical protein IFM61606_06370 [Aspergillus udagawae]
MTQTTAGELIDCRTTLYNPSTLISPSHPPSQSTLQEKQALSEKKMDKLSGLASKLGGSHSASGTQTQGQPQGEQKDYVDRGLDSVEQRFGGGKVDPAKMRSTNEKITDAARGQFEKATGHKVPEKFSN